MQIKDDIVNTKEFKYTHKKKAKHTHKFRDLHNTKIFILSLCLRQWKNYLFTVLFSNFSTTLHKFSLLHQILNGNIS